MGEHRTEAEAVAELAGGVPERVDADKLYSVVTPQGGVHHVVDLERFLPAPKRTRGTVTVQTVGDLMRYTKRHDNETGTTVWIDADEHQIVTVLNDHSAESAEWGDHRAVLRLRVTPEWRHWLSQDGKLLDQQTFAEHIEQGLLEIRDPDSATMLEVAQSIEGTVTAEFKSASRLDNGAVGIAYVEETTAAAGPRGELEIPQRFTLAIAPFEGEEPCVIDARLRYRIRSGDLSIGYRLERPHDVIRASIELITEKLVTEFPGDRVFIGKPRS
jgi:uncharacterized protein YfdQ (DUF2303 family)